MKNIRKICLLLALIYQPTTSKAFYSDIDEEFRKAEELMGNMLTTGSFKAHREHKDTNSTFEKSLNSTLRNIQENAKQIEDEARKMRSSLLSDKSFESMIKHAQTTFEKMKKEQFSVDKHLTTMKKTIEENSRLVEYKIDEEVYVTKSGENVYEIKIKLPSFEQKNIKGKLEEKDKDKRTLTITATKSFNASPEEKKKHEDAATTSVQWHSEKFFSSRYINNRQQAIDYKDGNLTITVDLPTNIHIKDYTMNFEKDELVVTFPVDQKSDKTTELKFSSKEK